MGKICKICQETFGQRYNLRAHIKKFHPGRLEELAPLKSFKIGAVCQECNKTFVKYSNLIQHVKKYHNDKLTELTKPKKYPYECDICQKHFTHLRHFKYHKKGHEEKTSSGLKCILCKKESHAEYFTKPDLLKHFRTRHDVDIITEQLYFISLEEFKTWKREEENKTKELFVNAHGTNKNKKIISMKYKCHRSGFYKSKGEHLRHLKSQGSKKIDGYCPAEISVKELDGRIEVQYVRTHVGHTTDLGHLNLDEIDRQALAVQIAAKIPFEQILDEVRESMSGTLERCHLLTKKDLHNIERSLNLNNESRRHYNDAISVDAWVKEIGSTGCVLFYKAQGENCNQYPLLKNEDFALIIMNEGQLEMLDRYGDDCICIDETFGLNMYDFNLTTILILDDMREGFPCAFLISNRSDEHMMHIFFMSVKISLGRSLKANVFMTDMAPVFYNAWITVMDLPLHRLYCTWHLDRAWRSNLSKINLKEKQVAVYKKLRTLLQETDKNAFSAMISTFLANLSEDPDTTDFAEYFHKYYTNNIDSWAYCYRINTGINTNMHVENMHRSIKYIYLNGKVNKRLDHAIYTLMKFVRDKLFSRLIVLNKGKVSTKLKELRARHKTSDKLNVNSVVVSETGWIVPSSSAKDLYQIEERQKHCNCKLVCTHCDKCIHKYSCSCLDSSIKWNMCKHIHLVCKFLKSENVFANSNQEISPCLYDKPNLTIDENGNAQEELEEGTIIKALSKSKVTVISDNFNSDREKFKLELIETINSLECSEELIIAKKTLAPLVPTLKAFRDLRNKDACEGNKNVPHNKKISQQRRLFKTKKRRVGTKKDGITKPDGEEINKIALNMLLTLE